MWNTKDLDFDDHGRLIVLNRRLARELEKRSRENGALEVIELPRRPPSPQPPPPDEMCACTRLRLELIDVTEIEEPHSPELEHASEVIQ